MVHVARMHAGEMLSAEAAEYFQAMGRGSCRSCGFIRAAQSRRCPRCSPGTAAAPPRRVQQGDIIVPTLEAQVSWMERQAQEGDNHGNEAALNLEHNSQRQDETWDAITGQGNSEANADSTGQQDPPDSTGQQDPRRRRTARWRPPGGLFSFRMERREPVSRQHRGQVPAVPDGFMDQVRRLRGGSVTDVPKTQRDRLTAFCCDWLEGSSEAEEPWGQLHEALTKLTLAGILEYRQMSR